MLIQCPECESKVSDKAVSCPHCGFPLQETSKVVSEPNKPKRKRSVRHKLPNGSGSVQKLSGNRVNKYAAYPPCERYKENGVAVRRKAIGYYPTYNEAYSALIEYTKNPLLDNEITFSQVYDMWFDEKFSDRIKKLSKSSKASTVSAYKNCKELHDKQIISLTDKEYQDVIDRLERGYSSKSNVLILIKGVSEFALKRRYINMDYSQFLSVKISNDAEKGEAFDEEQMKVLWKNKDNEVVQTILMMCYTGHRINEYKNAVIDLEERTITGGLKNKRSKERVVPIPDLVFDYIKVIDFETWDTVKWRNNFFYTTLEQLGIAKINGKKHTPHDCRHTFSWLCDRFGVDKFAKAMMMGHSLGSNVEDNTYGHRTLDELRNEINKLESF